jgi:hypothetical protein
MQITRRGRPSKYAGYDALLESLPKVMEKRPRYRAGIGVFCGSRETTAWRKIRLPPRRCSEGQERPANASVAVKLGNLASWDWQALVGKHTELQGKAGRGEALEDTPDVTFGRYAEEWLACAALCLKRANRRSPVQTDDS